MHVHSHNTLQIGNHHLSAIWRLDGTEWFPGREQESRDISIRWSDESELISRVLLTPTAEGIEVVARNGFENHVTIRYRGETHAEPIRVIKPGGYMVIDGKDKSVTFDSGDNVSRLLMGKLERDQLGVAARHSVDVTYAIQVYRNLRNESTLTPLQLALLGRIKQIYPKV